MKDTPYYVAGKTGSAEFGSSLESSQTYFDSHAWFTAFAWDGDGADSRRICLTIVLEEEGTGSVAVPVARRIFDAYFLN
jgi:cell division protein FtsI/penicillin-binding protein 2